MKISLYTLVFGVLLVLIIFLFIWRASKNGLKYSVLKTVAIILSAVFSVIGSKQLSYSLGGILYDKAADSLSKEYSDLLKSMGETGSKAFNMLIAPIVFIVIFIILYFIISAIGKSVICIISKKKLNNDEKNVAAKILAGINALVFFAFITIPFSAYASIICSFAENIFLPLSECELMYENKEIRAGNFYSGDVNGFVLKFQDEIIIPAKDDIICSSMYKVVGGPVMNVLTEYEIDGENSSLSSEWDSVTRNIGNIIILFSDAKTDYFSGIKSEALNELTDENNSVFAKISMSNVLMYITNKWKNQETFLKISAPEGCSQSSLVILEDCDKSNVHTKIHEFITSINKNGE